MKAELAKSAAEMIIDGFKVFLKDFKEITVRAKIRFENRDWHGIQADSRRRLNLYKRQAARIARHVKTHLGDDFCSTDLWREIKASYFQLSLTLYEYEIGETFLNSVCRKVLGNIGADLSFMFVADEHTKREYDSEPPIFHSYIWDASPEEIVRKILLDYQFDVPYEDLDRDIQFITDRVNMDILYLYEPNADTRIDVLKSVFYRNKGAYIVGRIHIGGEILPFLIPLLHGRNGVFSDTLITNANDMSIIFSFTRSYFLVEVDIPSELVHFLKSVMPLKPYSDLYNSIGFNKHGKTELYRHFLVHLENSDDQFVIAPGIKGMVMSVFMLPSYHIVFKLIKDKFDPPKSMNRGQVKAKYKVVSLHDRVGRMARHTRV